jgi:alpha-L-rhamnosidase
VQVLVASDPDILASDRADLWDTGMITTPAAVRVTYAGQPLTSRQRCWWKVRLWDGDGHVGDWSDSSWFELSLLEPSDWKVGWTARPGSIGAGALYLRQAFELDQPAVRARLYVTGLGWVEPRLNGHRVGSTLLDPVTTDVTKRVPFRTYDVTDLLRLGVNVLGGVLGHGWGGGQKLCAQLEVRLADGTDMLVGTGGVGAGSSMWVAYQGPIVEDSIYDGETYDARFERPGWDCEGSGLPDPGPMRDLQAAMVVEGPGGVLEPAPLEPIEVVETHRGVALTEAAPGVFVLDTGQNAAGWLRITVDGPEGTEITLRYAESLYPDGTVNQENLRAARATDRLIVNGSGRRTWEPSFTYHGYRYVQIEGWPGRPSLDDLEVRIVRTAMARRARFTCSDDLIQSISDSVYWTEASNVHGVPTDCPQRNERMGWLNDMAARSEELVHTFDTRRFLPWFVTNIADTQDELGAIADTVPFRFGSRPADPVSVCYALIPWLLIKHHGDFGTAERHYDGIRRWFDYLTSRSEDGILSYSYYGDWAPPVSEGLQGSRGFDAIPANTPGPLTSTAHYYYTGRLLIRLAQAIGRHDQVAALEPVVAQIGTAFHDKFWAGPTIGYGTGNQASNSLALYFGLVPEEFVSDTVNALVCDIRRRNTHLSTGNLCTKYMLEVLADHGHAELAVDLIRQTTYPSWGYMLQNGATTIWERWELATGGGMNSHNHPMYASVGAWLYRWLAGIQVPDDAVGMSKITIRPHLTPQLDEVAARLDTVHGALASGWRRDGAEVTITVDIPIGVEAQVLLPPTAPGTIALEGADSVDDHASPLTLQTGHHQITLSGQGAMV